MFERQLQAAPVRRIGVAVADRVTLSAAHLSQRPIVRQAVNHANRSPCAQCQEQQLWRLLRRANHLSLAAHTFAPPR